MTAQSDLDKFNYWTIYCHNIHKYAAPSACQSHPFQQTGSGSGSGSRFSTLSAALLRSEGSAFADKMTAKDDNTI